uniref:Uncharacterized protein n=1 Tax=Mycena chlorophos TaxID=658473 RepID=A0ABQ0L6N9_MYCCL|nr:predicted protein [Mycena chlorophos]
MASLLEIQRQRKAARVIAPLPARNENIPPSSPLGPYNTNTSSAASAQSSPSPFAQTPAVAPRLPPLVQPRAPAPLTVAERVAYGDQTVKKLKVTNERQLVLIREFAEVIQVPIVALAADTHQQTTHPEHREIFMFAAMARNHVETTSHAIEVAESWVPTPDQGKIIRQHAQMILLLPDLKFFSGALSKAIVSAIETKARYGFPTEANDTAHTEFERSAARQVTLAKNALKTKIKVSIEKKTPITQLANELLASSGKGLEHTLALHQHLSLLVRLPAPPHFFPDSLQRMHVAKGHPGHSFWELVDVELDELYAAPPEDYVESMHLAYTLDKEKYPARTSADSYPFGKDASQSGKRWIQALNTAAKKVGRVEPGEWTRATKRKRGDRGDSDDEDEEEQEEPAEPAGTEGDWDDEERQPPVDEEHDNTNTEATPRTPGSPES